ncbi:MAG TPA: MFS transporter [Burkholderiaceae bacterium]|nr:MFS transporter [Burkholderiaceae bacterium]
MDQTLPEPFASRTASTRADSPPGYAATISALAIGQLLAWAALYYAFSSFVLPMRRHFGWTEPQTMGAFTLGLALWGAASYAVGAAIDRGRGRLVLSAGSVLAGAGFLLWARVQSLAMLYGAWALLGISMAMLLYEPAFMVLTKRYPQRYRQGITALTLVGGFASTLAFPAASWLIAALDWRGALGVIGLALIATAPLHAWALRGPAIVAASPAIVERAPDAADPVHRPWTLREALRSGSFWLLTLAFALNAFAAAAMWAHLMPAFAAKGLDQGHALAIVVWFGPAQVAGRFAFLLFGRRLAPHALGLVVLCCLPLSLAIFALAHETYSLLAFALLFGLANGLVTIVRGSLLPERFGRARIGEISGTMAAIALLSRAGAPLGSAAVLVFLAGDYRAMLLMLVAIGGLALLAFALAGRQGRQPRAQ